MKRWIPAVVALSACAHAPPPRVTTLLEPPPSDAQGESRAGAHAPLEARVFDGANLVERARGFLVDDLLLATDALVPARRCLLLDVAVARGVQDADLEVYAGDGRLLASDRAPERLAAVLVCSRAGVALHAVASVARGAGEVAIRSAIVDDSSRSLELLPPSACADDDATESDRFIAAAMAELASRGFDSNDEVRRVDARAGVASAFAIAWRRGECVSVVGRSATGRLSITLDASASGDSALVRDAGEARDVRVEACVSTPGSATVRVESSTDAEVSVLVARGSAVRVGGRASLRYGD